MTPTAPHTVACGDATEEDGGYSTAFVIFEC